MNGVRSLGRIWVTGGNGFLGRHLVRQLRRAGHDPICWMRSDGDLADTELVAAALESTRPDTIFHIAAEGVLRPNSEDPGLIVRNRAMIDGIVAGAKRSARIVAAGSMTEYGRNGVLDEAMQCTPLTDYNRGKYQAGLHLMDAAPRKGIEAIHARLFHLYGQGEPEHRLFPAVFAALPKGQPVDLSDCLQRRDLLHVEDAARWMIGLGELDSARLGDERALTVNVGTGVDLRLRDVICGIADALGADQKLLNFGARERLPVDLDQWCADTALLQSVYGAVPPQRIGDKVDPDLFTRCTC